MPAAVILAGGLGTRLRPVVTDRPKVLAQVGGRPFVEYLLEQLAAAGVTEVVLCTGHLGEQVAAACGDGSRFGLALRYSQEDQPLGTAGALRLAAGLLGAWDGPVLLLNGDSYVDASPAELLRFHRERGALLSLLLVQVPDVARYGAVQVDQGGAVQRFGEKQGSGPGYINAGVYALERAVIERIPGGRAVSLEAEILPGYVGAGLYGLRTAASFIDIGTPESLAQAQGMKLRS